ncbi:ribonuclease T2-like isoform X3 [Carcharodon carcharias]|uniref:ribonuclease T2-like isoform X3 n=1 Tax=Carcharodon carcharias TaxID=13397 RepID=UPI001B7D90F3|nr:ribonuclease T2-like isoform X3 [Carcharodon carcharias]
MALYSGICLAVLYGLIATTAAQADMKDSCHWKCLEFAQLWPGSFCMTFLKIPCRIPKQVDGWTIHGLWPDGKTGCNRTWKLTQKDIDDLQVDLRHYWPSLVKKDAFKFWMNGINMAPVEHVLTACPAHTSTLAWCLSSGQNSPSIRPYLLLGSNLHVITVTRNSRFSCKSKFP